jgi:hypothetical protein
VCPPHSYTLARQPPHDGKTGVGGAWLCGWLCCLRVPRAGGGRGRRAAAPPPRAAGHQAAAGPIGDLSAYRSLALGESLTSLMAEHPHSRNNNNGALPHSRNVDLYICNRYDPT